MIILVILLVIGLLFLALGRKIENDVEKLDADYTGNIIPDEENEFMYHFERRAKIRNSKGAKYFGYFIIFWFIVWSIIVLIGGI